MQKTVTLFHGTLDTALSCFTAERIGRGGDANSALGVFFGETPEHGARYAAPDSWRYPPGATPPKGVVLVAEVDVRRALVVSSISDFFGLDDGPGGAKRTHEDFARARERLLADGYDCVVTDGNVSV